MSLLDYLDTHTHAHMIMYTKTHKIGRKGGALWIKGWTVNITLSVIEWKSFSVVQARELDPSATIEQWWLMRMTVPLLHHNWPATHCWWNLFLSFLLQKIVQDVLLHQSVDDNKLFCFYKVKFIVFSQYVRVQTWVWMPFGLMLNHSSPQFWSQSTDVTWGWHISNVVVRNVH